MGVVEEIIQKLISPAVLSDHETQRSYFISINDGNISEKLLEGAEFSLPNPIGKVKAAAPVAYVLGAPERTIITVNPDGALSSHSIDSDDDWAKGALDSANIKPHHDSKLAAAYLDDKTYHVYYQNSDGKLAEASSADGVSWQSATLSNASPRPGTFLATIVEGDEVVLLYQNQDGRIHSHEHRDGSWLDKPLSNSQVDGMINSISLTEVADDGFGLVYLTSDGKVVNSDKTGNTESLGAIDSNGVFKASSSAECGKAIIIGGRRPRRIVFDKNGNVRKVVF